MRFCEWSCCRLFAFGPIASLFIVTFVTCSTVWIGWHSEVATKLVARSYAELILFLLQVFLLLLSFFITIIGGPGGTPSGWSPSEAELHDHFGERSGRELPLTIEHLRALDLLQFCRHCKCHKPPRTHHCSACHRCVPVMDHHCPWTNQCVGHKNLKAFFLFTAYVAAATVHSMWIHFRIPLQLFLVLWQRSHARGRRLPLNELLTAHFIGAFFVGLIGVVILCTVGCLAWDMSSAILENITQVEDMLYDTIGPSRTRRQQAALTFPYNCGAMDNWRHVMGNSPLLWWLPTRVPGDGVWVPVKEGGGQFDLPVEQLALQAEKLSRSHIATVSHRYDSGICEWLWCWCCMTRRFGLDSMCRCPPCGDGLNVKPGDRFSISRWSPGWAYGRMLLPSQGVDQAPDGNHEGWVPLGALHEDVGVHEVAYQVALQGTWKTGSQKRVRVTGMVVHVEGSILTCVLRGLGGETELLGCKLTNCDAEHAYWSNGDVWERAPDSNSDLEAKKIR